MGFQLNEVNIEIFFKTGYQLRGLFFLRKILKKERNILKIMKIFSQKRHTIEERKKERNKNGEN